MSEPNNENNQDLDSKIVAAMEKIVQETIGDIPQKQPSPSDTSKLQKRRRAKNKNKEQRSDQNADKKKNQAGLKEQSQNINEKKNNQPVSRREQNTHNKKNTAESKKLQNAVQGKSTVAADKKQNGVQNNAAANKPKNSVRNKNAAADKPQNGARNKNAAADKPQNGARNKKVAADKSQKAAQNKSASNKPQNAAQNKSASGKIKNAPGKNEAAAQKQEKARRDEVAVTFQKPQNAVQNKNGTGAKTPRDQKADTDAFDPQEKKARNNQKSQLNGDNAGKNRTLKKALRISGILVGLAVMCVYAGFAYYYRDKFMPGTWINNIECKELSAEDAEARIKEKVEDYSIKLVFREDKSQSIKGSDVNYAYVSDGSVEKLLENQNSFLWLIGYFKNFEYEFAENISFDEGKLKAQYNALDCLQAEAQIAPENAYVNFQNGHFEIVAEIEGTTIDSNVFFSAVEDAIFKSEREIDAEKTGAYVQPEIRSNSEALDIEQNELNALGTTSIVYQLPQGEEVLNGNVIRHWYVRDEQGHYTKDDAIFEERLIEFIATIAERTDTVGKERPFTMTGGREITVSGGSYGWKINQSEEIAALKQNIANNDQLTREPVYSTRELTTENNGFGSTYIEINLTDQHLYYYVDGEIAVESDFVSGRMTNARYTPPGIFTMYYKQRDRVLRGTQRADGSYEYESHVNFWMPFNRGIGLHDASWRGSFGGTTYRYSGSHGCINMPYAKAQAVYELIDKTVPIICYYPDGYSLY